MGGSEKCDGSYQEQDECERRMTGKNIMSQKCS